MEFTREQTNTAKGVAILLMFAHHLFGFSDRLLNGNNYIPLIPFFNLENDIGKFGGICVSMFLFLSGYGMYLGYIRSQKGPIQYSLTKLKDFYLTYWLYFLLFVPIGIFFFRHVALWQSNQIRYSTEPVEFLRNFTGLSSTYNGEWWFVRMFVMTLILLLPLYLKLAEKNVILLVFTSLFLFSLTAEVSPYDYKLGFIFWQISFALGIVCARVKFFSSEFIQNFDKLEWTYILAGALLCYALKFRFTTEPTYDFLIVPFFIYFSIRMVSILGLSKLFAYLGNYSFAMWLIHSFFCYYYFQDIIYFPRWSLLIFVLLTVVSLLSVLGIEYLRCRILNFKFLST